jgi:hypothetical protein
MATEQSLTTQLNDLVKTYDQLIAQCYVALREDAPQEERDALRDAIKPETK